jgi:PIN like domain/Protein of unknown function (DUF1488)
MRNKFAGFYPRTEEETNRLWKEGWFVLDTNVLLNLYRYGESTRKEWLAVIDELRARVWLPHHVALEYQRNRRTTIQKLHEHFSKMAEATSFDEFEKTIRRQEEEMKSVVDPSQFIADIKPHFNKFAAELTALQSAQLTANSDDPVRAQLDTLAVGEPYTQAQLEQLYAEGERRYQLDVPPGYADKAKLDGYTYDGRTYKHKFGDWIVWKQTLDWARSQNKKCVILVTDDRKEDWWWKDKATSGQKVGPRPELVAEMQSEGGVEQFHIYTPSAFLGYAKDFLKVIVSASSIAEVETVAKEDSARETQTPMLSPHIVFTDRFGTDFDHHAYQFAVLINGMEHWCVVPVELVRDFFSVSSRATSQEAWEAFRFNEPIIREAAREAINNINIGDDGRFVIGILELTMAIRKHTMPGRTTPRMTFPRLPELDVFCQDCTCRKALTAIEHPVCSCGHRATRHN